ncbi:MAG TPA: hypothetical protein VMG12_42640 [Polyangiaceae bacterium]|nr:hypothetical protein [Polyangiaceae bacterium]
MHHRAFENSSNIVFIAGLSLSLGALAGCILPGEGGDGPETETGGMGGGGTGGNASDPTPSRAGTPSGGSGGTAALEPAPSDDCEGVEPLPRAIESDLTVGPGCVRIDDTEVNGSATLSVLPGTRIEFLPGGFLSVARYGGAATLAAVGTEAEPIVFTSSNPNPRAGDWQCIYLGGDGSELDHVTVEYGGAACGATGAGSEGMLQIYGSPRGVTHSTLRDSSTVGVVLDGTPTLFENDSFERNAEAPMRVFANSLTSIGANNRYDDGDVILVEPGLATRSGTWINPGVPYRVTAGFGIQGEITVAAGVRIEMTDGSLDVGSFDILGTAEAPVVFTSAQDNPQPGDWGCLFSRSAAMRIEHAVFEYAGSGQGCTGGGARVALMAAQGTTITDSVFRNIDGAAFQSDCGDGFEGWCANTFENVSDGPIQCGNELTACPE